VVCIFFDADENDFRDLIQEVHSIPYNVIFSFLFNFLRKQQKKNVHQKDCSKSNWISMLIVFTSHVKTKIRKMKRSKYNTVGRTLLFNWKLSKTIFSSLLLNFIFQIKFSSETKSSFFFDEISGRQIKSNQKLGPWLTLVFVTEDRASVLLLKGQLCLINITHFVCYLIYHIR
jgi:hypothetical protein